MRRIYFLAPVLILLIAILSQCSGDDSAGPDKVGDAATRFSGITVTNSSGQVLGGDSTDWCYSTTKSAASANKTVPTEFALYPAYVNPSGAPVRIDYDLPASSAVHLYIIDTAETTIRDLVSQTQVAGSYSAVWDQKDNSGSFVTPGIYGCVMDAGSFSCFGDIQIDSTPDHIILYSEYTGSAVTVTYQASDSLGALLLVFDSDVTTGAPVLGDGASNMTCGYNSVGDKFHVLLYSFDFKAILAGSHTLLTFPVSAAMPLDSADASDYDGHIMTWIILDQ